MAIFDTTAELGTQRKTTAPDIVKKGEGAGFMKALGYDPTTGQENKWGKVLHAIPGMSTMTNLYAGGISKGTDINKVLKEGRDEAISYDLNKVALGLDVFKMAAAPGMGGAAGFSNPLAQTLMGGATDVMSQGINSGDNMNKVSEADLADARASMSPQDYKNYVEAMGYDVQGQGNQGGMNGMGKYNNFMNTLGNVGGVANSLARTIQGGMAYNNELKQASKGLYQQENDNFSYL